MLLKNGLSLADHRSLLVIEKGAAETLKQCGFLRKNALHGDDDGLRFMTMETDLKTALYQCEQATDRYYKSQGRIRYGLPANWPEMGKIMIDMREHPLIISAHLIPPTLSGIKTQTRRIGTRYDKWKVGEGIWIKENYALEKMFDSYSWTGLLAYYGNLATLATWYKAGDTQEDRPGQERGRWRSARFMPKCLSRFQGEIISLRDEHLQDITEEDAKKEGVNPNSPWGFFDTYRNSFAWYWDILNAKRGYGWQSNPLVKVIEWKK